MGKFSCKLVANDRELKEAFEARKKVFVEEQGISEEIELDSYDRQALHMVVKEGESVIGTARVMFLASRQAKIERMAVLKSYRRRGIGKNIISFLNAELKERRVEQVVLHAQYTIIDFYKSCGFEETGSPFWEAGIKHIKMQRGF